ncbi:exoglucanase repeat family protein, partial [Vanderwaltozyma polyspora DSM 70294]
MLGVNIFLLLSVFVNLTLTLDIDTNVLRKNGNIAVNLDDHGEYKGINLGGWLVTEPYITPSLYKDAMALAKKKGSNVTIINEYTLCEALGYDDAKELLDNHFKTWITEDDFKKISEEGFNYVKIPIGYWAWKIDNTTNLYPGNQTFSDPYVNINQKEYLNKALGWALKYDLKVFVNVYAVQNSTNYFDLDLENYLWENQNGIRVISSILKDYFDYILNIDYPSSLASLEVTFSPMLAVWPAESYQINFYTDLFDYYQTTKDSISNPNPNITFTIQYSGPVYNMTYHDLDLDFYNSSSPYYKGIEYKSDSQIAEWDQVFLQYRFAESHDFDIDQSIENIAHNFNYKKNITGEPAFPITFVGSWSSTLTDCTPWIHGIGYGSWYDDTYDEDTNYEVKNEYDDIDYENYENYTCVSQNQIEEWPEEYKIQVRKFMKLNY